MKTLHATPTTPAMWTRDKPAKLNAVRIVTAKGATAIRQTGSTLRITGSYVDGVNGQGHGPLIESGDLFNWKAGGGDKALKYYGCGYFGNLIPRKGFANGSRIKIVILEDLNFPHASTGDALARFMGVDELYITRCFFNGTKNIYGKQAVQIRHARKVVITDSEIYGSICFGSLNATGSKNPIERAAYLGDAQKYRNTVTIDDKTYIGGNCDVGAQTDLTLNGTHMVGPDPRFIRSIAIGKQIMAGVKPPTVKLIDVVNLGWKQLVQK